MKEIRLKVADAKKNDRGRGIVRIGTKSLAQIGVSHGSPVEIIGKRKTGAVAWTPYSKDADRDIIRIDDVIRFNAGLALDEFASIRPARVENARKVILAPVGLRLNVDEDFINFVKNRLVGRVFFEGDKILVFMLEHEIPFEAIRAFPRRVAVRLTHDTALSILNEPFSPPKRRLERPIDIRYLVRFDWLNNLAGRIKATKTVFSALDYDIRDEDEQKVLDAALKIADEDLTDVRIEVSLESNGTIIGTLPWAEVDAYGKVSAIYPDIPLPPVTPSFTPQGDRGKVVPPMRRCFKTGVKKCPKEINFSPRSVVVAMPFMDEFKDAYAYAIRPSLEECGFKPWKADEQISNIDIMCKICHAIQESGYVLANITTWNPNVVFELGLAYGLGRNVILIKHKRAEVPVDLGGLEYIEYSTIDELKRNLLLFLKGAKAAE